MKLILILLITSTLSLTAQDIPSYYQYIHQAEQDILNDSLENAIINYEEAFKAFDKPFSKDINNALVCAIKSNNFTLAADYIKSLILLGCNLEYFRSNPIYKEFIKTKDWFTLVSIYPKLKEQYYQKVDLKLKAQIEALLCKDQFWRNQDPNYTYLKDSTYQEDEKIMNEVMTIFAKGYPSEYQIGLTFQSNTSINHFNTIPLILLHNYTYHKNHKQGIDLTDELLQFVYKGELHNALFAYLHDRSSDFIRDYGYGENSIFQVRGQYYTDKPSEEIYKLKEENRKRIWLESQAEFYNKFSFQVLDERSNGFTFFTFPATNKLDLPEDIVKKVFNKLNEE